MLIYHRVRKGEGDEAGDPRRWTIVREYANDRAHSATSLLSWQVRKRA